MPAIQIDGRELSYTDTGGNGTPVLLVHAFPMHAGMWDPQIQALGDRFRFITPDLMGFGASTAPEDRAAYSVDGYADDLAALLDELGIDDVTLVGLSMGGYIAFAFLRKYRSKVSALVLADTRAEADDEAGKAKRSGQQDMVAEGGTAGLIDALVGALLGGSTRDEKADVVDKVRKVMDNPAAGFIGALEALKNRPDSSGELAQIDVPTLVIVGEDDAVTTPEMARRIHDNVAGSKLVEIPRVGHLSNLEDAEAFNAALEEFLSSLR